MKLARLAATCAFVGGSVACFIAGFPFAGGALVVAGIGCGLGLYPED